jgi:hypothetical protein
MALLCTPEFEMQEVHPENGEVFTLQELQAFVGRYIEIVGTYKNWYALGNVDGIRLGLPLNARASNLIDRLLFGDILFLTHEEMEKGEDDE